MVKLMSSNALQLAPSGDRIFWDFIDVERNNVLKEYKFGVVAEPTYLAIEEGGRLLTEERAQLSLEEDFFRLSHVGFENREERDGMYEAIRWWRKQLDA